MYNRLRALYYAGRIIIIIIVPAEQNPVPLNFMCSRYWNADEGRFQFQVTWSTPDSQYLRDNIRQFFLQLSLVTMETEDQLETGNVLFNPHQSNYSNSFSGPPSSVAGAYFRITVS